MAPCDSIGYLPIGFKFHPSDDELVGYYLLNKVNGTSFIYENVVPEFDLYSHIEPWDIWIQHGGKKLQKGEDLYFFTKLKKVSDKESRVARTIGSGTWKGENTGTKVRDPANNRVLGLWKRFHYENTKSDQNGCWIMHEYSLHPPLVKHKSNLTTSDGDQFVLCRIRKNDKKRKLSDAEEDNEVDETPIQSQNKILRQHVGSSDNVDNCTSMSTDVEVTRHYGQKQTTTSLGGSVRYLPTGLTDQPHYFVQEEPSSIGFSSQCQREYIVADPTMVSSLPRSDYLDQFNYMDQPAGLNYVTSQFPDGGDYDTRMRDFSPLDTSPSLDDNNNAATQSITAQTLVSPVVYNEESTTYIHDNNTTQECLSCHNIGRGMTEETSGQFGSENAELNVLGFQPDNDDVLNFQIDDDLLDLIQIDDDDLQESFTTLSSMGMGMETIATTEANNKNDDGLTPLSSL